tara:strand:+ start:2308 stop:3150 length:843 start_codon:yes stop_codon:yes gene_type:complete
MATDYLLVHGPGYGNWIWDELRVALNKARTGYRVVHGSHNRSFEAVGKVVAEDLPGHGAYQGADRQNITTEHYIDYLSNIADSMGLENVVLVAQGGSGALLPRVADRIKSVKHMVFLGAAIPSVPFDISSPLGKVMRDLAQMDSIPGMRATTIGSYSLMWQGLFLLRAMLKFEDHKEVGKLHKALALPLLCNGVSHGVAGSMIGKTVASPFGPWVSPVESLPSEVPASAVSFKQDRMLPIKKQRKKSKAYGISSVLELEGGHLSGITRNSERIAEYLLAI